MGVKTVLATPQRTANIITDRYAVSPRRLFRLNVNVASSSLCKRDKVCNRVSTKSNRRSNLAPEPGDTSLHTYILKLSLADSDISSMSSFCFAQKSSPSLSEENSLVSNLCFLLMPTMLALLWWWGAENAAIPCKDIRHVIKTVTTLLGTDILQLSRVQCLIRWGVWAIIVMKRRVFSLKWKCEKVRRTASLVVLRCQIWWVDDGKSRVSFSLTAYFDLEGRAIIKPAHNLKS